MAAHELGFMSSWKMLTRDDGWIKPVIVLTLVGWIPIVGTIALYGYALEWARLTAWGVDSAPKQRGVNYSKVLTTGGIAFLVSLSMTAVVAFIGSLLFGTGAAFWGVFAPLGGVLSSLSTAFEVSTFGILSLLGMVFNIVMAAFIVVAALRSTIYDSFAAGWRLDRLFQMVGRDVNGFIRLVGITLIASAVNMVYSFMVAILVGIFFAGSIASALIGFGAPPMNPLAAIIESLIRMGPALLLLFVVLVFLLGFVGGLINTAMQLVVINATGQWFSRFELHRWGVSSDPLPDGVPAGRAAQTSPFEPGVTASPIKDDQQDQGEEAPAGPDVQRTSERGPVLLPPISELIGSTAGDCEMTSMQGDVEKKEAAEEEEALDAASLETGDTEASAGSDSEFESEG